MSERSMELNAYWGPRAETATAVSDRLYRFLHALAGMELPVAEWYLKGHSTTAAQSTLVSELNPAALQQLVERGASRRDDTERSVMTELGFQVALWNGQTEQSASLTIAAGLTTNHLPNSVLLDGVGLSVLSVAARRGVLGLLVDCWQPDEAFITDDTLRDRQSQVDGPEIGYLTYVPGMSASRLTAAGLTTYPEGDGAIIELAGADRVAAVKQAIGRARPALPC